MRKLPLRKKILIPFLLIFQTDVVSTPSENVKNKDHLAIICAYAGPFTFLLSYPRSGNTWMRYVLEFTTGRPSFHRFNLKDNMNRPLAWLAGFDIDISKAPIEKIHSKKELGKTKGNSQTDYLILIVRNPKEALSRHGGQITLPVLLGQESKGNADPRIYFNNIALYNSWNPARRLLIYYEDMIVYPRETFQKILAFLNEPFDKLDEFMAHFEEHKQKAITIYKVSESEGNDLLYHSKMISPEHRKQIDAWIQELYPTIWQHYLQARYAEENLTY